LPGTSADVEILLERRPDVVRVPTFALLEGQRVLVLEKEHLVEREVEVGLGNWEWTEIAGGPRPGRARGHQPRPARRRGRRAGRGARRVIRLAGIWRTYVVGGREVHALAGVDERIERGEHVAVMGPSGSGKSTLLNVIGLLDRPTRGSYELDGREVSRLDETELARVRREEVGYVFQAYHLVPRLDARRNVELPMLLAACRGASGASAPRLALAAVDLGDRLDHKPSEMSGGERQRVAIRARHDPAPAPAPGRRAHGQPRPALGRAGARAARAPARGRAHLDRPSRTTSTWHAARSAC
jgi:predicted ABC-type transport system involved in lysophospholipase L1 biosynthesis ATPase subunit